jgi:hypothetical protein
MTWAVRDRVNKQHAKALRFFNGHIFILIIVYLKKIHQLNSFLSDFDCFFSIEHVYKFMYFIILITIMLRITTSILA